MKRTIIEIDEALCNGCGDCAEVCAEGAIRMVDGKAKVVREEFCDGFGNCVGTCPTGALTIVTREAPAFDEHAVVQNLRATGGDPAVQQYESAHEQGPGAGLGAIIGLSSAHGSSGGRAHPGATASALGSHADASCGSLGCVTDQPGGPVIIPSELRQWPVQLHLVQPGADCFRDRELAVVSTCGPVASAEIHQRYLRGRAAVIACPKLDDTSGYAQKLGEILKEPSISRLIVVIMAVPCCGGLMRIALQALQLSGRDDLAIEEHTLALTGELKRVRRLE
jgi:NAD-dependent dihydropyrimidine dehydrogenase PreA subunit